MLLTPQFSSFVNNACHLELPTAYLLLLKAVPNDLTSISVKIKEMEQILHRRHPNSLLKSVPNDLTSVSV